MRNKKLNIFNPLRVEHPLSGNFIYLFGFLKSLGHGAPRLWALNEDYRMKHLSKAEIAIIKARILRGDKYSEIASDYRINQGRISDLKFGRIYREIDAADLAL